MNPNVQIEIAAMALVVAESVTLSFSRQRRYEVRYRVALGGNATTKLLEVINEMKR